MLNLHQSVPLSEDQSHQSQLANSLSGSSSLSETRAMKKDETPIKVLKLEIRSELIIVGKTGHKCSSVRLTIVASLWMWLVRHCGMFKDLALQRGAVNRASRMRYRLERRSSRICPFLIRRASRAARGWAMHFLPARILNSIYVRRLSARLGRNVTFRPYVLRYFRLCRADQPATFELRP